MAVTLNISSQMLWALLVVEADIQHQAVGQMDLRLTWSRIQVTNCSPRKAAKAELATCEVLTSSTSTAWFSQQQRGPEIGCRSMTESKHKINDYNIYICVCVLYIYVK